MEECRLWKVATGKLLDNVKKSFLPQEEGKSVLKISVSIFIGIKAIS